MGNIGPRSVRGAHGLVLVLGLGLGLGACGGPSPSAPSPAAGGAASAAIGKPLSKSTLSYVNRPLSSYKVAKADPAAAKPPVSGVRAVEVANQQVMGARGPAQMSLVRYSNKVASRVEPSTGKRRLAVTDRLAWAMVYDGFQQAASAAPKFHVKKGKVVQVPRDVTTTPTSLVMFVDAATGDYLEGLPITR